MNKTIFITGASTGLGKATARLFHSNGWNVIATMRNPDKETELNKLPRVTILRLDVTDPDQVGEAVSRAIALQPVDLVLNNAGYGLIGVLEALSEDQIRRQLDTNLMGVIRVTKAFTPYFRERRAGMFINIISMFGLIGYPMCSVYSATKFAVDGFSESMSYDLANFGVTVKIVAPGGIQTDFAGRSLDGGQHEAYAQLAAKVGEGYSEEKISQYSTAGEIAAVIFEAATDGKNQLRYVAGKDANKLYNERLQGGPETQSQQLRETFVFG